MTTFQSVAPVLPVRDIDAALARYERLGFVVEKDEGDPEYGFAHRDNVRIHFSADDTLDPPTSGSSAYLYVDDADVLYTEWLTTHIEGRLHRPVDTHHGLREGAYVDPDGNLLRFGSYSAS